MKNDFPLWPVVISGFVGAADGAIASTDVKNSRAKWDRQWSTYFQGGALAVGLVGALTDAVGPDVYEPLIETPTALLTRRLTFAAMTRGLSPVPVAQGMVRQPMALPAPSHVHSGGPAVAAPLMKQSRPSPIG